MKKEFLIFFNIFLLIIVNYASAIQANEKTNEIIIDYEYVYKNINNKIFLQNYPHNIVDFTFYNYNHCNVKNDINRINIFIECLKAIYNNNHNWHDIISKINYYREIAILTNSISSDESIKYYKKFLYLIFKAEDGIVSGKLKVFNLEEEIFTYRFTAIKILSEHYENKKILTNPNIINELIKKTKNLKDKLFSDNELINTKDINDIF